MARGLRSWFLRAFSCATNCDSIGAEFFPKTTRLNSNTSGSRLGSRSLQKSRKWNRSCSSISIWRYISFMSQATPTGFRRQRTRTLKRSCCNFGPAWIMSFKEIPSHLAAQSNTIRTFVVDLSILTTRKWGKYHTLAGGCASEGTFRKYPFST